MGRSNHSGLERRRFRRISRNFVARVLPLGGDVESAWNIVFIRNISKGGVLFSSDKAYKQGMLLWISINVLDSQSQVKCKAKVIRCQATVESQIFDVAVELREIRPEDSKLIERSIDDYLNKLGELGVQPE